MLKKPASKADIRAQLEREIEQFLKHGGEVDRVAQGISGKDANDAPLFLNQRLFVEPRSKRTLLPDVVAAIEARRQEKLKHRPAPKRSRRPQPREKIIYDDFGEPLRKIWIED